LDPRTEHEAANFLAEDQESDPSGSANGDAKAANGSASASNGNASGANGSKNSANGSAGAPNGHQPSSMLLQRTIDTDFRTVLGKGLAACRRNIFNAAIFSFVVNVLLLAMPIYLFQLSDRVYTSRSQDTLIMLSVVVGGAIIAHVFLDMIRRFILMRVAVETEAKLGAPVLSAAAKASQNGSNREFQMLGDLQHLRSFITGPVILMMMDVPVAPIYLAATFLIHPDLGWIVRAPVPSSWSSRSSIKSSLPFPIRRRTHSPCAPISLQMRWRAIRKSSTPWA